MSDSKMQIGQMRIGQVASRSDEAVWLNIAVHNGQYLTWGPAEDEDVRELLEIAPEQTLPGIKIRRWSHPKRNAFVREALKRYRRLGATIPAEIEQKIIRESAAHVVLLDWRGIAVQDGSMPAYAPEIGVQAFKDDPDFYDAVLNAATTEDHFRAAQLKEDADALGEA